MGRVRLNAEPLILYPQLVYRRYHDDAVKEEAVLDLVMRCYYPDELLDLVRRHGFTVATHGEGTPMSTTAPVRNWSFRLQSRSIHRHTMRMPVAILAVLLSLAAHPASAQKFTYSDAPLHRFVPLSQDSLRVVYRGFPEWYAENRAVVLIGVPSPCVATVNP